MDAIKGYQRQPLMDGAEPTQLGALRLDAGNTVPGRQQVRAEEKARIG